MNNSQKQRQRNGTTALNRGHLSVRLELLIASLGTRSIISYNPVGWRERTTYRRRKDIVAIDGWNKVCEIARGDEYNTLLDKK